MLKVLRYPITAACLFVFTAFTPLRESSVVTASSVASPDVKLMAHRMDDRVVSAGSLVSQYDNWNLNQVGISKRLFDYAVKGYVKLVQQQRIANANVISIADLSKPSHQKRFYVINISTGKILFRTWVAHGKNSGKNLATQFSNSVASFETSLGFYTTSSTYMGAHGYSLKLNGCERGFNDNAEKRAIVLHGAEYVSKTFIQQNGYLGRSLGCPAVPAELSESIINEIKNGSCLFVYAPVKKYLTRSTLLKG